VIRKLSALPPTAIDRDNLALSIRAALQRVQNFLTYWQAQPNRAAAEEARQSKRWSEDFPLAAWSAALLARCEDQKENRPIPYLHNDGTAATVQFLTDALLYLGAPLPEGQGVQGGVVVRGESTRVDLTETPMPTVDAEDLLILQALEKRAPCRLTHDDIGAGSHVSRKTISLRLRELLKAGLVCQPAGPKKGTAISETGRRLLHQVNSGGPVR
jgi:hypothetical protein